MGLEAFASYSASKTKAVELWLHTKALGLVNLKKPACVHNLWCWFLHPELLGLPEPQASRMVLAMLL